MNPLELIGQLKSNPAILLSSKFNIPQGMNDPNQIIQNLLNTGQVTQDAVNRAMQMRNNPMIQQLLNKR